MYYVLDELFFSTLETFSSCWLKKEMVCCAGRVKDLRTLHLWRAYEEKKIKNTKKWEKKNPLCSEDAIQIFRSRGGYFLFSCFILILCFSEKWTWEQSDQFFLFLFFFFFISYITRQNVLNLRASGLLSTLPLPERLIACFYSTVKNNKISKNDIESWCYYCCQFRLTSNSN